MTTLWSFNVLRNVWKNVIIQCKVSSIFFIFFPWYSNIRWVSWGKKRKKTRHLKKTEFEMSCLLQRHCYILWDAFQIHLKNSNKLLSNSNSHNIQEHIYLKELKCKLEKKVKLAKRKRFLQSSNTRWKFMNHINSMCEMETSHTIVSKWCKELINQLKKTYTWKWEFQELQLPQATCTIH
jgi:hypothetical protein